MRCTKGYLGTEMGPTTNRNRLAAVPKLVAGELAEFCEKSVLRESRAQPTCRRSHVSELADSSFGSVVTLLYPSNHSVRDRSACSEPLRQGSAGVPRRSTRPQPSALRQVASLPANRSRARIARGCARAFAQTANLDPEPCCHLPIDSQFEMCRPIACAGP